MAQVGYVRVSTPDQRTARQLYDIRGSLDRLYEDSCSGKSLNRPQLNACLDYLHAGDVLHIESLDRLARSLNDLLKILEILKKNGVILEVHSPNSLIKRIDPRIDDPQQKFMLQILGAVGEFERSLIRERQMEGVQIAKLAGKYKGTPYKLKEKQASELRELHTKGVPVSRLAREFEISRATVYKYLNKNYLQQAEA